MMDKVALPDEIKSVMQNGVPAIIVTCSAEGIPNTTIISQVYYVDPVHVALSFQFFNKTVRNVRGNPHACVCINDLVNNTQWILDIQYDHSETEGSIFNEMDMQIEAIASMTGMSGIFNLRAADVYLVKSFKKIAYPTSSTE